MMNNDILLNSELEKVEPELRAFLEPAALPTSLRDRLLDLQPAHAPAAPPEVIGRVGSHYQALRLAAAVGLAALVGGGLWYASQMPGNGESPRDVAALPPAGQPPLATNAGAINKPATLPESKGPAETWDMLSQGLDRLAAAERSTEPLDDRLDLLAMQVALTRASTDSVWGENALESLDNAMARDTLDLATLAFDSYY